VVDNTKDYLHKKFWLLNIKKGESLLFGNFL